MNPIAWAAARHWAHWLWWLWPWAAPRRDIRCTFCGRAGHIAANCPDQPWRRR